MMKISKTNFDDIGYRKNHQKDILIYHMDSSDYLGNIYEHKPYYLKSSENENYNYNYQSKLY